MHGIEDGNSSLPKERGTPEEKKPHRLVEKAYARFLSPPESSSTPYLAWSAADEVLEEEVEKNHADPIDLAFQIIRSSKVQPFEVPAFNEVLDGSSGADDWPTFCMELASAIINAELIGRYPGINEEDIRRIDDHDILRNSQ